MQYCVEIDIIDNVSWHLQVYLSKAEHWRSAVAEEIKLGKYLIKKELGQGGFGFVYEAYDTSLDRLVALKALHPNLISNTVFLSRFKQEAKLAARLEHPNIVPVYDFNQVDGRYFIAMGLMTKGSLEDILKKYGPRSSAQAKKILEQIATGMAYAHERGVIHRDLKPGNILIDEHNVAKIADFGFAKAMHSASSVSLSMTGGVMGTPAYMAPEIWRGKEASAQSDIYSLGCIAYEMLTGKPLFIGESAAEIMTKHVVDGPSFRADLPDSWRKLIEKCLANDLSQRYPTAKAVLEDLKIAQFDGVQHHKSRVSPGRTGTESKISEPAIKRNIPGAPMAQGNNFPAQPAYPVSSPYSKQSGNYFSPSDSQTARPRMDYQRVPSTQYFQPAPAAPGKIAQDTGYGSYPNVYTTPPENTKRKRLRLIGGLLVALSLITIIAIVVVKFGGSAKDKPNDEELGKLPFVTYSPPDDVLPMVTIVPEHGAADDSVINPEDFTEAQTMRQAYGAISTKIREADGMEMVYVPEGNFIMGSDEGYSNEKPEREVYLEAFWIDKYEVSNAQFARCVTAGYCQNQDDIDFGNPKMGDYPVVLVDWDQANAYCAWVGGSLPTEAQWEKAARGPNGNEYPWGNESPTCDLANYNNGSDEKPRYCIAGISQVGSFPMGASYYGAMDMAGNVWEWVYDWYAFYTVTEMPNPGSQHNGSEKKVIRGGSWGNDSMNIRSAFRYITDPSKGSNLVGFRCAFPAE